jgi:hypothetical protein
MHGGLSIGAQISRGCSLRRIGERRPRELEQEQTSTWGVLIRTDLGVDSEVPPIRCWIGDLRGKLRAARIGLVGFCLGNGSFRGDAYLGGARRRCVAMTLSQVL